MDHARHLAPPSPNSSFLFHHSERPFKSNLITPPNLPSPSDVNHDVNECFSLAAPNTENNQSNHQDRLHESFGDSHDVRNHILVTHDDNDQHSVTNITQSDINLDQHHQSHCVIGGESLNGVGGDDDDDDDDGMHNMLSGSSTSSTTTIPLLTDNHSHHPFSRISLSEYSPLSLVDDCDNALTISPTSLVCGSHSFKSSLNNLKLENLDGVDVNVDDVVGDARSMSPSLMSATTSSNHQNQSWSISSTAITQNPALLSNPSSSFLLSHHHHHHQLSSLMHQLEPQSLDESPPLISHGLLLDTDHLSHNHHHHRPSSEPPPGSDLLADINNNGTDSKSTVATKTNAVASTSSKSKQQQSKSKAPVAANIDSATSSNKSSRKNRNKSSKNKQFEEKFNRQEPAKKAASQATPSTCDTGYSCKVHLQLNHQQKLKELQQRLFGSPSSGVTAPFKPSSSLSSETNLTTQDTRTDPNESPTADQVVQLGSTSKVVPQDERPSEIAVAPDDASVRSGLASTEGSHAVSKPSTKPRIRRTPKRKSRAADDESGSSAVTNASASNLAQKSVKTESVEPDTTTKSSDCIKLADLLSTTTSIETNSVNPTIILSNNPTSNTEYSASCEQSTQNEGKRIQHIQLQVSPTLKLMANGNLVQSMSLQQQLSNNVAIVSSNCGTLNNQVICRPISVITSVSGNEGLKSDEHVKCNIVASNDWLKNGDVGAHQNCLNSSRPNQPLNGNSVSSINSNQAIGAHQIAIQVICQDGTSLVLPVSAASGLNTGLTPLPNQQLQAVLTNGIKGSSSLQQRQANQMLPLISVSNILAQQHANSNHVSGDNSVAMSEGQSSNQVNGGTTQSAGLAASSPTLAALLDAGTNRGCINTESNNLLRKCVGGTVELKRSDFSLQPGTQIGLTNNGSLVTICATNNCAPTPNHATNTNVKLNHGTQCIGDKRLKLDNVQEVGGNIQTTLTLIEPQGLIVANGNDVKLSQDEHKNSDQQQLKLALGFQSVASDTNNSGPVLQKQLSSSTSLKSNTDNSPSNSGKSNKMTASTGNRPVDPTQPFRCEHCNSTFTRLGNFTRHKKIHSAPTKDGQRFKCDVCSKSFLQRCDLARHLHIHRGTEPHRCNICGKGYIRHSDLVTHQRFHNKEKPFGCPNCHKGFCQRGDLNRHLRSIHLQLKPLLCPCCNRKFAKRDTLLKHLSTHHRGYSIELLPP